jgi:hypothetical protein
MKGLKLFSVDVDTSINQPIETEKLNWYKMHRLIFCSACMKTYNAWKQKQRSVLCFKTEISNNPYITVLN